MNTPESASSERRAQQLHSIIRTSARRYEYELVRTALARAGGVKIKAAEALGLNKDRMKYLCKKYDL
jgi:transcriptional regulator with GAF, ATPase, and Fis domain